MHFDSKETEEYYYKRMKELKVVHVNVAKNTVLTKNDVDELIECVRNFSIQK